MHDITHISAIFDPLPHRIGFFLFPWPYYCRQKSLTLLAWRNFCTTLAKYGRNKSTWSCSSCCCQDEWALIVYRKLWLFRRYFNNICYFGSCCCCCCSLSKVREHRNEVVDVRVPVGRHLVAGDRLVWYSQKMLKFNSYDDFKSFVSFEVTFWLHTKHV